MDCKLLITKSGMSINSPVSGKNNTTIEKIIKSKQIIDQYINEFGFDCSDHFKNIDEIYLMKCLDSGYSFYYPFKIQGGEDLYQHLEKFDFYYLTDRWEFETVSKLIHKGANLLEIGCGNGYALEIFKKNGISCHGLELNQRAISQCISKGLNVSLDNMRDFAELKYNSFDAVCAFQLLEHLSEVDEFISNSIKLLKQGGNLIVSVPNNDSFGHKYNTLNLPPHHMGLWNKFAFESLEKFYPVKLKQILFSPLDTDQENDFKIHYSNAFAKLPIFLRSISRFPSLFKYLVPERKKGYTILAIFEKI